MLKILLTAAALIAAVAELGQAANTVQFLNVQRAYFSLPPLRPSARLQAGAEEACRQRSRRGLSGHLAGRPVVGRWEGTARRNSRQRGPAGEPWGAEDVFACYQNHRQATYVGCASVYSASDGFWYYQLNLDTRP